MDKPSRIFIVPVRSVREYLKGCGIGGKLYRGLSRDTLPVFAQEYGPKSVDFIFIQPRWQA